MFKVGDKVVILTTKNGHVDQFGSVTRIEQAMIVDGDEFYQTSSYMWYNGKEIKHFEEPEKQSSDGGSTDYYQLPEGATELFDLINHRNMNFAVGNIFKACYRLGEKDGINNEYDLRKIVFMAKQELKRIGGKLDDI